MNEPATKHLFDVRHACEQISRLAAGMSYADYASSEVTALAVERLLITIGEAIVRLRDTAPNVASSLRADVRGIITLRNKLVHNYNDIDQAVVYVIVTRDIPELLREVRELVIANGPE